MNCCTKCFRDKVLVAFIRNHGNNGVCDFCKRPSSHVIDAAHLLSLFKPLIEQLEPVRRSDPRPADPLYAAIEIMPEWHILAEQLPPARKLRLLKAILSPQVSSVSGNWSPRMDSFVWQSFEELWSTFSEHIRRKRRFVLGKRFSNDPKTWLPQALEGIAAKVHPNVHFKRARVGSDDSQLGTLCPLQPDQLKAPPWEKTLKGGRANPPGISYLYVAQETSTAIAESKPYIGALVSIMSFAIKRTLTVADLTQASRLQSPFGHEDLSGAVQRADLLLCLNDALAEPINPDFEAIDYVPCQYVVEIIRDAGFDGVRYRSAMHEGGHNIVFFDPDDLEPAGEPELFRVDGQQISYKKCKISGGEDDVPF